MTELSADLKFDAEHVCQMIERCLRGSLARLERDGFVVGLSGGLDSAVMAAVICKVMGPDSLLGVLLPELDSNPQSERDAMAVAKKFGFRTRRKKISSSLKKLGAYDIFWPIYYLPRKLKERIYKREHDARNPQPGKVFMETRLGTQDKDLRRFNAFHRAKVRMRMVTLYMFAELENRVVVGTTNYSEHMTGWFAKWGDSLADVSPLVELYKTQVWELARYLDVPQEVIDKRPSPDLVPGMYDEDGIGLPFHELDLLLAGINRGMGPKEIAQQADVSEERVKFVHELIRRTQHMREMTPFPSLGIGKRIHHASEIDPKSRQADAAGQ